ncbi:hypothetical protein JKY72_05665 [Candidatus Gracilibacteria bacterium]|nr:hypothetical protein [Candidatus Gracilibacteria bacterium]
MKKFTTALVAMALVALSATSAFADSSEGEKNRPDPAQIMQIIQLVQDGDFSEAQTLANQIDLTQMAERGEKKQTHKEAREALENEDFAAWSVLIPEDAPFDASQTNFDKLLEAHQLAESGDREAAKEIFEELGLKKHHGEDHIEREEDDDDDDRQKARKGQRRNFQRNFAPQN